MKCYICGEDLRTHGSNAKKVNGRWIHKVCPTEAQRRKQRSKKEHIEKKIL